MAMVRLWTDFSNIYDHCYTWTSLEFAELSPGQTPAEGEWAALWDYEGNRCYGIVTRIENEIVHLKLDWSTWVPATRVPDIQISGLTSERLRPGYWVVKKTVTGPDRREDDLLVEAS